MKQASSPAATAGLTYLPSGAAASGSCTSAGRRGRLLTCAAAHRRLGCRAPEHAARTESLDALFSPRSSWQPASSGDHSPRTGGGAGCFSDGFKLLADTPSMMRSTGHVGCSSTKPIKVRSVVRKTDGIARPGRPGAEPIRSARRPRSAGRDSGPDSGGGGRLAHRGRHGLLAIS